MNEHIEAPSSPRPRAPRRARDEHLPFFSIFSLEFSFLSLSLSLFLLVPFLSGAGSLYVISKIRNGAFED